MITTEKAWSWPHFFWAVFLIALPNIVLSLVAHHYGLERPYLNVDYAFVMLVLVLGSRVMAGISLSVVFFFDVLGLVGQVIPVLRLSDVIYILSFINIAPLSYQILAASLILVLIFLGLIFLNKNNKKMRGEFLVCINMVVAAYLYGVFVLGSEKGQVWSDEAKGPIASQTVFAFNSRQTGFVQNLYVDGDIFGEVPIAGATSSWFEEKAQNDERILLVVNESWGVVDDQVQHAVLKPILEARDTLDGFKSGILDFRGLTVEAEIRELCKQDLLHFNFEAHKAELAECLPNKLKNVGYSTYAFHGASGLMYDRIHWYPDMGFEQTLFFESKSWPRRCFSFPGACDIDMSESVVESFRGGDKVFSYWLTLNSHHAYDSRDIHTEMLDCDRYGIDGKSETCRNLTLQLQFFENLARMIAMPEMANVRVVVVGDHQPPITNKEEQQKYFEEAQVPWISFRIPERQNLFAGQNP